MPTINVEGLGIVEIIGDTPNEEETSAILESIRGLEETDAPPIPSPVKPPLGIGEIPLEELAEEGPFDLVPRDVRGAVRRAVKDLPGIFPMLAEMTPTVVGAVKGAGLGLAFAGPPGFVGGGIIGGVVGELAGQELGVGPISETNIDLAAAAPLVGVAAGATARLAGRAGGRALEFLPPVRVARARIAAANAAKEISSLGARILEKQRGLLSRPAIVLYRAARRAGVKIAGRDLDNTRRALAELREELLPFADFQQVKGALGVINSAEKSLRGVIDFETFIKVRQNVGVAVGAAKRVQGIKLGSAKKLFASMSKDLDDLASRQGTALAAKLSKAAAKRAKTEFAIRDMERLVARFSEELGEEGATIKFKGLAKAVGDLANPKSKKYDKNFVDGIGDALPDILKNLRIMAALGTGSPAGPGSIVVRGQSAKMGRAVIGGALGYLVGDVTGAAIGGIIGAQGPELLTGVLLSKPAIKFLAAAAKAGRGQVSRRAWLIVGQILTRGFGGQRQEEPFTALPPIATTNEDFLNAQAEAGF